MHRRGYSNTRNIVVANAGTNCFGRVAKERVAAAAAAAAGHAHHDTLIGHPVE